MSIHQKRETNQKLCLWFAVSLTVSLALFLTSCDNNQEITAYLASPFAAQQENQPSPSPETMLIQQTGTVAPTPSPSPAAKAAIRPTIKPTPKPTPVPTAKPTPKPAVKPTPKPALKKAAARTAKPTTAPASGGLQAKENQMIALVNDEREKAGLAALTYDSGLRAPARKHSSDMSSNNFFSHTSPTYGTFSQRLSDSGMRYSSAGENLAMYGSVDAAHEGLMNSSGHRANILNTGYTRIGIGIVYNQSRGMYYITQWFAK